MRALLGLTVLLLLGACTEADPTGAPEAAPFDASAAPAPPEAALAAIDAAGLRQRIAVLTSEGGETGTPSKAATVASLVEPFRALGLEGGMPDGSFTQDVPLRSTRVTEATPLTFTPDTGEPASFAFVADVALGTDIDATSVALDGADLVFVGYGITAPGVAWDDFKGLDVTGKVLVALVGVPPATAEDPTLFQATARTNVGRWTSTYEEARRRGAKGVLLIHTEAIAGYPFGVVADDAFGTHPVAAEPPEGALEVRGWIREGAARALAEMAGSSLDDWLKRAGRRDFEPVELPVEASVAMQIEQAAGPVGQNVVATIPGTTRADEAVVYSARLGVGASREAAEADGIQGDASGVAMLLGIAEAFRTAGAPERTVFLVLFGPEAAGPWGASVFADTPPVPLARTVANINIDSGNLFGGTEGLVGIGAERSDLGALLEAAAAAESAIVSGAPTPRAGRFDRSPPLALARGGVSTVTLGTGDRTLGGLVQQTRVAFRLGYGLANSDLAPRGQPGDAFGYARRSSLTEAAE
ncbi:MAG: M28 family peptidase [Bacteroidota bacterium]